MFDDPKKELEELEGQLLAAEEAKEEQMQPELDNEEFERLYDEILAEFGPKQEAPAPAPAEEPEIPVRNFANGYGGVVHNQPIGTDGDEILPDAEPVPTGKGSKGLIFLAVLECAAIAGVVLYWVLGL